MLVGAPGEIGAGGGSTVAPSPSYTAPSGDVEVPQPVGAVTTRITATSGPDRAFVLILHNPTSWLEEA